jgi:phytoene/squalene synthetase
MDLSSGGETFEALRYYLRVASAVGLICVEIFGYAISVRATTRSSSALRCS